MSLDNLTSRLYRSPITSRVAPLGEGAVRYALVFVIGWIGALKFTAYEANSIQPLVASTPLLSWVYDVLSVTTFSAVLGVVELAAAALIAVKPWAPKASVVGSVMAIGMFVATLSFMFTTPGVMAPEASGFPVLSLVGSFLVKDVVLLAVALWTLGDAVRMLRAEPRADDGPLTGRALLSHLSQYHAVVVADVIAARDQGRQLADDELIARDPHNLPQVVYTDPQVVEVGRTESQARADGFTVRTTTARYPEAVPDLAIFRDGFDAWAKLVIDADTDTLLGATFVGPEFAELAQAATLAVVAKVPIETLRHVVAPHPSINQIWNPLLAQQRDRSDGPTSGR